MSYIFFILFQFLSLKLTNHIDFVTDLGQKDVSLATMTFSLMSNYYNSSTEAPLLYTIALLNRAIPGWGGIAKPET